MNSVKYFAHFSNKIKLEFGFAILIYEYQYYAQNTEEKCQWDRHCIPPSLQVTVTHLWVLLAFFGVLFPDNYRNAISSYEHFYLCTCMAK
jgi:hypothetical protein